MKAYSLLLLAFTACSPFDPDLGPAPYLCSAVSPDCPEGYTCQSTGQAAPKDMACLPEGGGGELPDGGGPPGFQCLEDTFGQNDTTAGAFPTPVAATNQMFAALTSLCPMGDKDNYSITITTPTTLKVSTTWESGSPVNVQVVNAGGNPIGNGAAHGTNENCVCLKDLPQATYFATVSAASNVQNNYRVEIKVISTAECTSPPACN